MREFRLLVLLWAKVITAEFHPKLEICQRKEAEVDCYPEPPVAATAAPLLLVVRALHCFIHRD